jgi:hypothetical protein
LAHGEAIKMSSLTAQAKRVLKLAKTRFAETGAGRLAIPAGRNVAISLTPSRRVEAFRMPVTVRLVL